MSVWGRAPLRQVGSFFIDPKNKVTRVVGKTKNADKIFKCTKATADLTQGILDMQGRGGSAEALVAKNVSTIMGDTRTVLGLFNTLHGIIPVTTQSLASCISALGSAMFGSGLTIKERGECGLLAVQHAGTATLGLAVMGTFGAVRPVLFANKMADKPFLDKHTQAQLKASVSWMMMVGHAGGFLSDTINLCLGMRTYRQQYVGSYAVPNNDPDIQRSRTNLLKSLKIAFLNAFEKFFELLADLVKLVPLGLSTVVQGVVSSSFVVCSCCIGLYRAWTTG